MDVDRRLPDGCIAGGTDVAHIVPLQAFCLFEQIACLLPHPSQLQIGFDGTPPEVPARTRKVRAGASWI